MTPNRKSVGKQIALILLIAIVVPITIIGMMAILMMRNQINERYENQVKAENTRVKSILFDVTSSMYTNCEPIVSIQAYRDLLGGKSYGYEEELQYQAMTGAITSLQRTTAALSSIRVYTNNPLIPEGNNVVNVSQNKEKDPFSVYEWYQGIDPMAWDSYTCTHVPLNDTEEDYELTLVRRFNTGTGNLRAYVVVTISTNYLRNRLLTTDDYILISLGDKPVFFSSIYGEQEQDMPVAVTGDEYNYLGTLELKGKKQLTYLSSFVPYKVNDRFFVMVGDKEARDTLVSLLRSFSIVLVLAILGPLLAITGYTRYFTMRVKTLREAMHQASLGDYDIVDSISGEDELAETFYDLKKTTEQIRENESKYYEAKIRQQNLINMQQQMELKMLAGQINPHFLYNTLEAIRMQAVRGGDLDVATSVKYLAKIMHYVLESTGRSMSTLEDELKHVDSYMQIQRLRFGDKVNWNFYITDGVDAASYPMLPLLLQPIVENAVGHGLKNMDHSGHVSIIAEYEQPQEGRESSLIITVNDDGLGMSEEEVAALNASLQEKRVEDDGKGASSIGLYNIHQRIRLYYGKDYGMQTRSKEGKGTSVVLTLPHKGEKQHES